ncbi:uncharacterized protein LOC127258890 [Andrographis paniculata]|uniref:uncharacterized protein LOC127258890 n=1 Tax=Andrographis paniculata TaxID=175694 RepID=UPI0021E6DBAA|nr:uncharacterized protein LOC127258890 [Andrographis paniculata]XP_051141904.1 uncharacterized protein LOC127258890 [Andrographis paniculata]
MGCFLGCFGGAKEHRRRSDKGSPQRHRNRIQNVLQESEITAEHFITESKSIALDSELRNKPEGVEQLSPSPKRRVTFNSNVTAYDHVPVHESIDSQPDYATNADKEMPKDLKMSQRSHSFSEDNDNSATSSVRLYPPNHRYHNARDSDDEFDEYGDSDLDELDDEVQYEEDSVSSENHSATKSQLSDSQEHIKFGLKTNPRDRNDYLHSVLDPVENVTQWKAAKSKGSSFSLKPQKENTSANFDARHIPLEQPQFSLKKGSDQLKNPNQESAVDASLSNWLACPEPVVSKQILSESRSSDMSYEERPILGALTVDELKRISLSLPPSRSPDEMQIIGTVGNYWSHSDWSKHHRISASSFQSRGV